MVNTQLLDKYIKDSGKKIGFIATRAGLTRQGFNKKRNNKSPFNANEITVICNELEIQSLEEKDKVFFAPEVEENGNNEVAR